MLEPVRRNTAPAAAVAALLAAARDADAMILILPSDHRFADNPGFLIALDKAAKVAAGGALVTFGITPKAPETGYRYIKRGGAAGSVLYPSGCGGLWRQPEHIHRLCGHGKTGRAAVVSADIGWSDVGSWSDLWEHGQNQGDEKNNVTAGDVLLDDVSSSYIRAERRMKSNRDRIWAKMRFVRMED